MKVSDLSEHRIIIDTSVWVDYFSNRITPEAGDYLELLLNNDLCVLTDVIQYEILIGANTNQEYHFLKNKLKLISILGIDKSDLSALIDFGLKVKKEGLQGKFTDVSIAYLANKYHCPIFTFDQYFHKLAKSKVISVFNQ